MPPIASPPQPVAHVSCSVPPYFAVTDNRDRSRPVGRLQLWVPACDSGTSSKLHASPLGSVSQHSVIVVARFAPSVLSTFFGVNAGASFSGLRPRKLRRDPGALSRPYLKSSRARDAHARTAASIESCALAWCFKVPSVSGLPWPPYAGGPKIQKYRPERCPCPSTGAPNPDARLWPRATDIPTNSSASRTS